MTRITDSRILHLEFDPFQKFSFSRLKLWRKCEKAHHYKYYERLERVKKALPLIMGTAVHSSIESHINGKDFKQPLEQFRKDFNKLFAEEKVELGDLPTELEKIMQGYFDYYRNDGLSYSTGHRNLRCEIPVIIDLDNRTRFVGYIDALPRDTHERLWIMDHKSVKSIPNEEQRYADYQFVTYAWLLPLLGYPKPDGIIWDYLRKKAPTEPEQLKSGELSKAQKIDSTYDVYMATVDKLLGPERRADYEEFAATLKGREENFYRRIRLPNPHQVLIDGVVKDMFSSIEEIHKRGPIATVRSLSRDCSWCSYYSLCQAEFRGLDADYIRKTEYTIKETYDAEKAAIPDSEE